MDINKKINKRIDKMLRDAKNNNPTQITMRNIKIGIINTLKRLFVRSYIDTAKTQAINKNGIVCFY